MDGALDERERIASSYDVVVVGGGVAGLSGALGLARARRSVLVVDAGHPRNAPAAHAHGYLTRDGVAPLELVSVGRLEVSGYGGEIAEGTVTSIKRLSQGGFHVEASDGRGWDARRVLVTTGLVDELPDIPGLRDRWGRDVVHCPYCFGWELTDAPLGVLATGPQAAAQALLWRQWSSDLILFLHTAPPPTDEQAEQLAARGVRTVEGEVAAVEVTDDRLRGVRLRSGQVIPRSALVVGPRFEARHALLDDLKVTVTEHPLGIGAQVQSDPTGLTAINADLTAEDTAHAVAAWRAKPGTPGTSGGVAVREVV